MAHSRDFFLLLLSYAFVEIRTGEIAGTSIADIFHNVPEALRLDWTPERAERIWAQVTEKARIHGLSSMIAHWEQAAFARIEREFRQ